MTLLELLGLLRKNLKIVIALPIICALIMALVCVTVLKDEYTATTSIYALMQSGSSKSASYDEDNGITSSDLQLAQMLANDFAKLAESDQVKRTTATNLGLQSLSGYSVKVTSTEKTRLITISVTGKDPVQAAAIANELTKVLGETAVEVMGVEAVNVINEAASPAPRSGPPRTRYTLIAFAAGLFAAVALVVLRDMLNTTVRDEDEVQELTGLPVIGRFPYERGGK